MLTKYIWLIVAQCTMQWKGENAQCYAVQLDYQKFEEAHSLLYSSFFMERLHKVINYPFSAPILGPYVVNRSVLAQALFKLMLMLPYELF